MSTGHTPEIDPALTGGDVATRRWRVRLVLAVLAAAAMWLGWEYWRGHWRPNDARWPMQGVAVEPANMPLSWPGLATAEARFAYIDAVRGGRGTGTFYTDNAAAARAAGLRVGARLRINLCVAMPDQVAAYVRLVPRESDALPPMIALDIDEACDRRPTPALMMAELGTLVNQVETHAGKAAVVAPSAAFAEAYPVAAGINRPLVIDHVRGEPDPADGPWALWLANDRLRLSGASGSVGWLVLNDGGNAQ